MPPPLGKGRFNKDRKPKRNTQSLLFRRKRFCRFTVTGVKEIDYKDIDTLRDFINENGKIAPAPWVPFTRDGCDVGEVATANTILENTGIDIPSFFGPGSPEAIQANADSPGASATQTFADYVGLGVHCAQVSAICSASTHAHADLLPDEPGGYSGFNALMGAKYVDPVIQPNGPMTDLNGNVIQDQNGHVGFPGFDGMEATVSLSWVAQMQEAGIRAGVLQLAGHPPLAFLRNYLAHGGIRDGVPGLIISAMNAYYVFLKFAKLWELQRRDAE